jgi:hypothetical protein
MFSALQKLRSVLGGKSPRAKRPAPRRGKVLLGVETLEMRDVPTVLFTPVFGAETIHGSLSDGMQHPAVNLIFSGPTWSSSQGKQEEAAIIASVQAILNSPYLSGLTEYGSDGKANLGSVTTTSNTVTMTGSGNSTQATLSSVDGVIQAAFFNGFALPGYNDWQHAPIEFVISDPTSTGNFSHGYNQQGQWFFPPNYPFFQMPAHVVWVGTMTPTGSGAGPVDIDRFTVTFSHELVETMSDPDGNGITVTPPAKLPKSILGDGQIGDNEADGQRYVSRVDGQLVQAYWSNRYQAFIVPDGNTQTVTLIGIWKEDSATNTEFFTNTFQLWVNGDQLGPNYADTLYLATTNTGNLFVSLNTEGFTFELNEIAQVFVDTGGGVNTVNVYSLPSTLNSLTVESVGGTDTVNIGQGSLHGISSTTNIYIQNPTGQTSVNVNASLDGPVSASITSNTVTVEDVNIHYQASPHRNPITKRFQVNGTAAIDIDLADYSNVYAASVGTSISVEVGLYDTVKGPAAGLLNVHRRFEPPPGGSGSGGGNPTTGKNL